MLSRKGFAFFHRILSLVSRLGLHPFKVRNGLLINAESRKTHLIGWISVVLNILYVPLVASCIKEVAKVEGIIHSFLFILSVGGITTKMTLLLYHPELIQVVNNVVLLGRKIGKSCRRFF